MKTNFQTIILAIFLAFFVFGVLVFSGLLPIGTSTKNTSAPVGKVVIWGTFPEIKLFEFFQNLNGTNQNLSISYVQKSEETYQNDILQAQATGTGPDIFILSEDMITQNKNFIYPIPYASYPEKSFRDTFIDGADIYLTKEGVIGFPLVVDPLVLYYNKDLIANAGLAKVPTTWNELGDLNTKLTKKNPNNTISQSMIALGTFDNINHAKDVISALLIQTGTPITKRKDNDVIASLEDNTNVPLQSAASVMSFFSDFSNQTSPLYSWNRGLISSRDFFTGGNLALYIGRASELFDIEAVNPNLSFDVHELLQPEGVPVRRTFGKIYALAVNKKSANSTSAFGVANLLSSGDTLKQVAVALSLPPASRGLLSVKPEDPYMTTFFNSAIITRTWIDPNKEATDVIFREMVGNILSNNLSAAGAVGKAQGQLDLLLKK